MRGAGHGYFEKQNGAMNETLEVFPEGMPLAKNLQGLTRPSKV